MAKATRVKICGIWVSPPVEQPISIYLDVNKGPMLAGPYYDWATLTDSKIARDVAGTPNLRDVLESRGLIPVGECLVSIPVKVVVEHGEGDPEEYPGQRLEGVMLPRNVEHLLQTKLFECLDQRDKMVASLMEQRKQENVAGIKVIESVGKASADALRAIVESVATLYSPVIANFKENAEFQRDTAAERAKGTAESKTIGLLETVATAWIMKQASPELVKAMADSKPEEANGTHKVDLIQLFAKEGSNGSEESKEGKE